MSSSEYEMRRLEDKISDLHEKLEENKRMSRRNEERERWELDRLSREFDVRKHGYQRKKETLDKELQEMIIKRNRVQYQINKEKE
jgi:SMC interacting uncharacterized protein involved in chromosome segregation